MFLDIDERFLGWPHLYIVRGLPGSKKAEFARRINKWYDDAGVILSTNDYFIDEDDSYNFAYDLLGEAHEWNQGRAEEAMDKGVDPVIICNNNITHRHMKPYVQMGVDRNYYIQFRTTRDTFRCSVEELHRRANIGIPLQTMYRWKNNFQHVKNIYQVLNSRHSESTATPGKPENFPAKLRKNPTRILRSF